MNFFLPVLQHNTLITRVFCDFAVSIIMKRVWSIHLLLERGGVGGKLKFGEVRGIPGTPTSVRGKFPFARQTRYCTVGCNGTTYCCCCCYYSVSSLIRTSRIRTAKIRIITLFIYILMIFILQ